MTSCTGIARTTSTTSGSRCVMSARLRVNTRTSSPARCTWMRAPSSLYSTDASPTASIASLGLAAVAASIGSTGRPTTSPTASSSSAVPVSASRAVSPRSPESIAARRTESPGRSAARAIASMSTPSSAPVRMSPISTRRMKSCSRSVARAASSRSSRARSPLEPEPEPDSAARRSSAASRSATVRLATSAASPIAAASPRQPTPTRPWRALPTRNPTAGAISSGSSRPSRSASASTFASRERVAVTVSVVVTSSSSSTRPVCHRPPTAAERAPGRASDFASVGSANRAHTASASGPIAVVPSDSTGESSPNTLWSGSSR